MRLRSSLNMRKGGGGGGAGVGNENSFLEETNSDFGIMF